MKKRKANDGRATTDGAHDVDTGNTNDGGGFLSSWVGYFSRRRDDASAGPPSNEQLIHQSLSQMNNIMMRMEEKLSTVSNTVVTLESRCEQLEEKCSSLETILESTSRTNKTLKYHEMLIRNQNWEYPAPVRTNDELARADYDDEETNYIYGTSQMLKRSTEALRRGDFPSQNVFARGDKGIYLYIDEGFPSDDCINDELSPHWREFAAALKHFKPAFDVLSDDYETFITFQNAQLNRETTQLIKEALINTPFNRFLFQYSYDFHGGMSTIAEMMGNNKCLQKLELHKIQDMDRNDITELSSAINNHPCLVGVNINECFSDGLGDYMLQSLLRTDEWKLEILSMPDNHLLGGGVESLNVCTQLSDFLATNPRLKRLNLNDNILNDSNAVLIANALRSNTTLTDLYICRNRMSEVGATTLYRRALCDASSLNSLADSNHTCSIESFQILEENRSEAREINRAQKLYGLLSLRNIVQTNVQYFGEIDVNLLPHILEVVQKYAIASMDGDKHHVKALSIVYEVMRRWEKVSPLYKLG
eukprot:scaffold16013_cov84-Skeletonema_dohrnii-CCMP3373.AAC.2